MKKALFVIAIVATAVALVSCGNKQGKGQAAPSGKDKAETALPAGFKTFDFANFSISLPEEFTTSYGADSDNVSFSSEAMLTLPDGEEVSSSANVNCGFMTGGAKPAQLKETAANLKLGQEATGEVCDEPKISGNTITMRHYYENDGYKVITWRWWIVSEDGRNIAGNIYFPDTQAQFYEPVVDAIVKSIKFK